MLLFQFAHDGAFSIIVVNDRQFLGPNQLGQQSTNNLLIESCCVSYFCIMHYVVLRAPFRQELHCVKE